ncbi:MAG: pyridoxamine 5'-phosphate oxidase family protein [Parvibaculaceae bacterium]|nr:pyridoxamine 5'-phosphate oxidase family protein [Parvibaculaceae bacterium]HBM87726.1 pyridoxamine 5'-phosphate oxidase [Rhodobiaceae bacterium]|tara:strand:- start:1503 stop:2168 length:666 start_codon:yes stop_codon:yes gene_type:complete
MADPTEFYSASQRKIQAEQDSENLAGAMAATIVFDELQEDHSEFIASRDYFFLSSVNADGEPTVSYKGGSVGFVQVLSPKKLVFPSFDGNGMFYSMGNVAESGKIGLLFIDMETPHRVRVQGTATVSQGPDLMKRFPGSNMVVEVEVTSAFINCARYIHKHKRLESSKYVPDEEGVQPFPSWKRIDLLQEALPGKDAGETEGAGGMITIEQYQEALAKGES